MTASAVNVVDITLMPAIFDTSGRAGAVAAERRPGTWTSVRRELDVGVERQLHAGSVGRAFSHASAASMSSSRDGAAPMNQSTYSYVRSPGSGASQKSSRRVDS